MIITTMDYELLQLSLLQLSLKGEIDEKPASEADALGRIQIIKKPTEPTESNSLSSAILDAIEHGAW